MCAAPRASSHRTAGPPRQSPSAPRIRAGEIAKADPSADLDRPAGERVVDVSIGGAPLDPAKVYVVATNDFMARGGDGYDVLAKGTQLITAIDATLMASQVIDYVAAKGTVAPEVEGRIVMR